MKKKASAHKKATNETSNENKELQGSKCFGAELVMSLLANYCRSRGIKTSISVGVVGKWNCPLFAINTCMSLSKYMILLQITAIFLQFILGLPNVGKSSIINSLKRSRACNVGATPGVTK
jgi:Predicted GTPases